MRFLRLSFCLLVIAILVAPLAGCFPSKRLTVLSTAALLQDISRAAAKQSDLRTVRAAMPAYLLLMDGMVEAWPENDRILLAAAQGYSSFAAAFADDDKAYAGELTEKAKRYALGALERHGFRDLHSKSMDDFNAGLNKMEKEDMPFLFWAASCWATWIGENMESMAALAELPKVEAMMRRALALDPGFYYGGPHLFLGIWYASQPKIAGGDLEQARAHFLKAREYGRGKFLMTDVYFARYYARKSFDRELFTGTLQKVLDTPVDVEPELTLLNAVARQKAAEMLKRVDEYF